MDSSNKWESPGMSMGTMALCTAGLCVGATLCALLLSIVGTEALSAHLPQEALSPTSRLPHALSRWGQACT